MKKLIKTLLAFAATSLLAFSCSNEVTDSKALLLGLTGGNANVKTESGSRAASTLDLSVNVTIYLYGVPSTNTKPGVWAWEKVPSGEVNLCGSSFPGTGTMTKGTYEGYIGYKYELNVDPKYDLGILFNNVGASDGKPQTGDIVIPKEDVAIDVTYYFNWNSMAYYTSVDDCVGIMGGSITALNKSAGTATVTCTTSLLEDKTITSDVSVKDSIGTVLTVKSAVISKDVLTIKLENATGNTPYTITYAGKDKIVAVSTALIESLYGSAASALTDLGLTLNGSTATFKTWAPTASAVSVLLYDTAANAYDVSKTADYDGPGSTEKDYKKDSYTPYEIDMSVNAATGIWSVSDVDVSSYKYYKYKITISGKTYYVSDIWHTVAGADSNASQIISIDDSECEPASWETSYVNPFGNSGEQTKKYNDAVIYEMHVRDWSRAVVTDSTGKFLDIANSDEIMNHLKDLGVTHVQLLPVFDYAQLNSNEKYNWGYNPYHYNVPEGRYVTDDYTDGSQAVKEMRQMIKAFHDNGIAVIMDVVYNHTSATGTGSLYDSTVPGYFYSLDASGNYYSGSGCGNNIDTRHVMVRKYVIDSLVHWVNDYHINGFRFDLMGCLDQVTMKKVYDTLYAMDKNILVYGEPWTGGSTGFDGDTEETRAALKGTAGYGVGAFDDDYRDAIKGGEYNGFAIGQVQGSYSANIETGLAGETITKNSRNATGITGLALHYVECHDNFTLFDKLVYSTLSSLPSGDSYASKFAAAYNAVMNDASKLSLIKKQQMLAGAYVILGQGTPFLNGGQEFMRTKKGDPNSYAAAKEGGITWTDTAGTYNIDDVNTINLNMKTTYADVYNTYKGLIALRKANDAFTSPASCEAKNIMAGISKYTVNGSSKSFDIYFNATDNDYAPNAYKSGTILGVGIKDKGFEYGIKGKVVSISETDGSVSYASEESLAYVPAHGFLILEK